MGEFWRCSGIIKKGEFTRLKSLLKCSIIMCTSFAQGNTHAGCKACCEPYSQVSSRMHSNPALLPQRRQQHIRAQSRAALCKPRSNMLLHPATQRLPTYYCRSTLTPIELLKRCSHQPRQRYEHASCTSRTDLPLLNFDMLCA